MSKRKKRKLSADVPSSEVIASLLSSVAEPDDCLVGKEERSSGGAAACISEACKFNSMIERLLAADADENTKMMAFLKQCFDVDDETIAAVRGSTEKTFLTSMLPPPTIGSGVCLASRPWLDFCGFGECDVAWRQPRDLLQGPLTTQAHKEQMHAYFKRCGCQSGLEGTVPGSPGGIQTLRISGLINYRRAWDNSDTPSVGDDDDRADPAANNAPRIPFSFTLTVRQLRSVKTGEKYPIFQATMTDECDLCAVGQSEPSKETVEAKDAALGTGETIERVFAADADENTKMMAFLKQCFDVDDETIAAVRGSTEKTFLTSMLPPPTIGSGVCLASRPWLDFCGFGECDVAWRQPRDLLQGPLTTQAHKEQMHAYFKRCGCQSGLEGTVPGSPGGIQTLRISGLINYRRAWDNSDTPSVGDDDDRADPAANNAPRIPFSFTLTVRQLRSVKTGEKYPIFQATMTDECDLCAVGQSEPSKETVEAKDAALGTGETIERVITDHFDLPVHT